MKQIKHTDFAALCKHYYIHGRTGIFLDKQIGERLVSTFLFYTMYLCVQTHRDLHPNKHTRLVGRF